MIDEKAIEHRLILILRSAASFQEKAALVVPFRKASVVMELHIIRNHEQDNAIRQAFFEHDGAVDAPVVVLERVNALESSAKPDDILERPIRRVMPTKNTRTSSATRSGGMVGQPTTSFERRFQSPPAAEPSVIDDFKMEYSRFIKGWEKEPFQCVPAHSGCVRCAAKCSISAQLRQPS